MACPPPPPMDGAGHCSAGRSDMNPPGGDCDAAPVPPAPPSDPALGPLVLMPPSCAAPLGPRSQIPKPQRTIKEGDWQCHGCNNINFAKRTRCNVCQVPRQKEVAAEPHCGGPPGLFKKGDWPCTHCGNVNWARRDKCNMCNSPKPSGGEEPRMGRAGGHFDLQDPADRNSHHSDEEDYDEFGRKKKARKPGGVATSSRSQQGADYGDSVSSRPSAATRLAFPPAPNQTSDSMDASSSRHDNDFGSRSNVYGNSSNSRYNNATRHQGKIPYADSSPSNRRRSFPPEYRERRSRSRSPPSRGHRS